MYNIIHNSHKKPVVQIYRYPGDILGRLSENNKRLEDQEKEEAKKWGRSILPKIFTRDSNKKTAEEALKLEMEKLKSQGKDITNGAYKIIIDEYRLFMKDIFDEKGSYKQTAADGIRGLSKAIGIDGVTNKNDLETTNKKVSKFIEQYPLDTFVDKIHYATVKHPFISKTWVFFNEYGDIKKKVKELGDLLPPEYRSIIQTAENIMGSKEFQKNTGNIETAIRDRFGQGKTIEEFQGNMKTILGMSRRQKRTFTMNDFEKQFNEEMKLSETEKIFVTKYIEDVKNDISQEKYDTRDAKIARLNNYIESNKKNPNNLSKAVIKSIIDSLQIIQSQIKQGADDSLFGNIKDKLSGREEGRKKAEADAAKKTIDTGKKHFVGVSDGKFRAISILELKDAMESDVSKNVNLGAFTGLILTPDWQEILVKEFGRSAIAGVGGYLEKNPNTRLFQGENAKAKTFFINEYRKEVQEQSNLIKQKKIGELTDDISKTFPQTLRLLPELKTNPKVAEALKRGDMVEFYNTIITGRTNGDIKNIMSTLKQEINAIKVESEKKALEVSEKLKNKTVGDYIGTLFIAKNKIDEAFLEKMKSRKFAQGSISVEEAKKLLILMVGKDIDVSDFLKNYTRANQAGNTVGQIKQVEIITSKKDPNQQPQQLTKIEINATRSAGNVAGAIQQSTMNTALANQNLDQNDIEGIKQRNLQAAEDKKYIATTVATHVRTPGVTKDDTRELIREIYDTKVDDAKLDQWIDTQVFISKYVEEKNFVDIVEKNSAYMNLGQTKTVGELYGVQNNNISISTMSSEDGSIRLGNLAIEGGIQLPGINELMNCKMEIGDKGKLSRTIKAPDGRVIVEDKPLENIPNILEQLSRFYSMNLGVLAPYMEKITQGLSERGDKISAIHNEYTLTEDTKFLKIFITMIYGKEFIPDDPSLPNLLKVFNRTGREQSPEYLLKQSGVVSNDGIVNTTALDSNIKSASSLII